MHFVMYAFSNHIEVLHNVTPINLLDQSAVLSDRVVAKVLHKVTPFVLLQQTAVLFFNSSIFVLYLAVFEPLNKSRISAMSFTMLYAKIVAMKAIPNP